MAIRTVYPKISPLLVQLHCDCTTDYTVRNYSLEELGRIHDDSKKIIEFQALIKLNCNQYKYK